MGMKAVFICDECAVEKKFHGNISKACDRMVSLGWLIGPEVLCCECHGSSADKPARVAVAPSSVAPSRNASLSRHTVVHSDGSCVGSNPGHGGWAWTDGVASGSAPAVEYPSTNQRMEIQAAVEALEVIADPVHLHTDSSYVVNCLTKRWYVNWERNGWLNKQKKPVSNRDLWERMVAVLDRHPNLKVTWVKGHNGDPMNEKVDKLAREAAFQGKTNRESRGSSR